MEASVWALILRYVVIPFIIGGTAGVLVGAGLQSLVGG